MRPETNIIGSSATMTVRVATMVGLPTSATRLDRRRQPVSPVLHRPVAVDVLDHNDGVIHQDADREDQGEQRDAVQRVTEQEGAEQRHQDGDGDHHCRHRRRTPADGQPDEGDDRDSGQPEMEQQLVGLLLRRLAVVARDIGGDSLRNHPARKGGDALGHRMGNGDGIRPGALGDSDGDCRHPFPAAVGAARQAPHSRSVGAGSAEMRATSPR